MDNEMVSQPIGHIDLRQVPSSQLASELGRRTAPANAARRILRKCQWCKLPFGFRDMRDHLPTCIHNPRRRAAKKGNGSNGN